MLTFLVKRIGQAVLVMLAMSALVFIGVHAIGNPIDVLIAPDATQEIRAQVIAQYGLDKPLWHQYLGFLGQVLRGDFGQSFVFNMPVMELIAQRLPATLELALIAILFSTFLGVPLGMYAGYKPKSRFSRAVMALSVLGFSVPTFWIGILLVFIFALTLGWLPAGDRGETVTLFGVEWSFLTFDGWKHLFLPALNLSLFRLAIMIRLSQAGTREIMLSDTVKFARATGLSEWSVMRHHVLRLISIPLVTVFGLELGSTLVFAVVTETIFNWPGLGKLIINSILQLDRPVIVTYLVLVSILFIVINLVTDITYGMIDPRLRTGKGRG